MNEKLPSEDKTGTSIWNVFTLYEHFTALIAEKDRRYQEKFAAQENAVKIALEEREKATLKSEESYNERFKSVNEFRGTLSDQSHTFITRTEAQQATKSNSDKIEALTSRFDKLEGRSAGLSAGWIIAGQAISIIAAIIAIVFALNKK